jgi:predicted nuclease of predicted toxin-antitoxin system
VLGVLADEHVDPALLAALRVRGADADSINRRRLQSLPDAEVLALATREQRVLLTTDADFLAIAHDLQLRNEVFAPIVWWPQAERSIGQLLSRIVPILHEDYAAFSSRVSFV